MSQKQSAVFLNISMWAQSQNLFYTIQQTKSECWDSYLANWLIKIVPNKAGAEHLCISEQHIGEWSAFEQIIWVNDSMIHS